MCIVVGKYGGGVVVDVGVGVGDYNDVFVLIGDVCG